MMPSLGHALLLVDVSVIFWTAYKGAADDGDISEGRRRALKEIRIIAHDYPHAACCVDHVGRRWRKELCADYKANRIDARDKAGEHQLSLLIRELENDGFPIWQADGEEADDVIASAAKLAEVPVVIYSADKDMEQLVSERVSIRKPGKDGLVGVDGVVSRRGVLPSQMRDFLALTGDTSDNVAGIQGLGPKTAAALLTKFENIPNILECVGSDPKIRFHGGDKVREALLAGREKLALACKLISLHDDIPINISEAFKPRIPKDIEPNDEATDKMEQAMTHDAEPMTPPPGPSELVTTPKPTEELAVRPRAEIIYQGDERFKSRLEPQGAGEALVIAKKAFLSRLYPDLPNAEAALMIILRGQSLGMGAATALEVIRFYKGKTILTAMGIVGLVLDSGKAEFFSTIDSDDVHATYRTKRRGEPDPITMTWTMDDAHRARLGYSDKSGGQRHPESTWAKFPAQMLRWRCACDLARAVYPDVVTGIYTREELDGGAE